jgi:uncharacterized protein
MRRLLHIFVFYSAVIPVLCIAQTYPQPTGFVTDAAQILSPQVRQEIESTLSLFAASSTNEIAVVTVTSMEGDYIEHYAEQLFKKWGVGTDAKDNGIVLLLAIRERKARIEVGYGLEGALPDSVAARIIANDLTPYLKEGNYDEGVSVAVRSIIAATKNEYNSKNISQNTPATPWESIIMFLLFAGIPLVQWLASVFARSKTWYAGGLVGAGITAPVLYFLGSSTQLLVGGVGIAAALGLLFDYLVSSSYRGALLNNRSPEWWAGGSSFGGGSSGGFGGFGGGSSGGGGASGSW